MLDISATIFELILQDEPEVFQALAENTIDGKSMLSSFIEQKPDQWTRDALLMMCAQVATGHRVPCPELAVMDETYKLIVDLAHDSRAIVAHTAKLYNYRVSEYVELSPADHPEFDQFFLLAQQFTATVVHKAKEFCKFPKVTHPWNLP